METVTVKIHNSTQTIEEFKVEIGSNNLVSIEAQKNVNYEFFSDNIQAAPNHIVTKRVDEDLHVSFERSGQNTNLVIENFYEISKSYVIGKTEEDLYYYYIPDTTQVNDFINNLQMGDMEGHALGGEQATTSPWWIGESEAGSISPLPSISEPLDIGTVTATRVNFEDPSITQNVSNINEAIFTTMDSSRLVTSLSEQQIVDTEYTSSNYIESYDYSNLSGVETAVPQTVSIISFSETLLVNFGNNILTLDGSKTNNIESLNDSTMSYGSNSYASYLPITGAAVLVDAEAIPTVL